MSTITLLTQKVTQLAQTVNAFISNSKKIEELPNQDSLDLASLIHVSRGGVSEKLELQLLATALSNNTFNRIISIGGDITVVDNDVTVPAINWSYDNVTFSIATDSILSSPYTTSGYIRTDIIVVKNNGTIELIQGNETEGIAIRPQIPAGAILVTQINVTDSEVGEPDDPLIGDAFVKKSFAQAYVYPDITGADASIPIPASGASQIVLSNASLTSIACLDLTAIVGNPSAEVPYPNKIIEITNSTGNDIELKHATGSGIQFFTKDELSIIIPNKESLYVKYNDDGAVETFKSWSSISTTQYPKLILHENQIDNSIPIHTGSVGYVLVKTFTLPANSIPRNCTLRISMNVGYKKSANYKFFALLLNNTNVNYGRIINYSTLGTNNNANERAVFSRDIAVLDGFMHANILAHAFNETVSTQEIHTFDETIDNDFNLMVNLADASDWATVRTINFEVLK